MSQLLPTVPTVLAAATTPVDNNNSTPDYLAQLIKDRKNAQAFPNLFLHVERLLDEEISRVRSNLFQLNTNAKPLDLPEGGDCPVITKTEKIFVPVKAYPDFNFVGRILGPRGMTAKQLEKETGCKIMVRGKSSMRDKKKEEQNRGKPNWEHLNEELHVLITVEDTEERCTIKLQRAKDEVNKLLVPAAEGEDDLKKRQLMELAIINGTYRDNTPDKNKQMNAALTGGLFPVSGASLIQQQPFTDSSAGRLFPVSAASLMPQALRSPTPGMAATMHPQLLATTSPFIPRMAHFANGAPPSLVPAADAAGTSLLYSPYDASGYPYAMAPTLLEYATDPAAAMTSPIGAVPKIRRHAGGVRDHPYQRQVPGAPTTTSS